MRKGVNIHTTDNQRVGTGGIVIKTPKVSYPTSAFVQHRGRETPCRTRETTDHYAHTHTHMLIVSDKRISTKHKDSTCILGEHRLYYTYEQTIQQHHCGRYALACSLGVSVAIIRSFVHHRERKGAYRENAETQ